MLRQLYAQWMYRWETALTTRDSNRIVRPVEWGFDWLVDHLTTNAGAPSFAPSSRREGWESTDLNPIASMQALNADIVSHSEQFFSYQTPKDFRLEERHPQLFPTNIRPETLKRDELLHQRAQQGKLKPAQYLRFTSPIRTKYPENDQVNARWYPAPPEKQTGKPKQAIIVMPQWNADAFSHNALCALFNRFGISALRLSKPYHDIRRPAELERSDYACSSNIGRTISACQQGVVDIRCCLDWLEQQGYQQFGVLGTSLGSCYAFIAAAHDPRLRVAAFNHAAMNFGDIVWTGQSTRHIRAACEQVMTQQDLTRLWAAISPSSYMEKYAAHPKRTLVIHATYDLTFRREFSMQVLENFRRYNLDFVSKVLPCGHYTTGETPYKFIDGWYLGSFVYQAFKQLAIERPTPVATSHSEEEQLVTK